MEGLIEWGRDIGIDKMGGAGQGCNNITLSLPPSLLLFLLPETPHVSARPVSCGCSLVLIFAPPPSPCYSSSASPRPRPNPTKTAYVPGTPPANNPLLQSLPPSLLLLLLLLLQQLLQPLLPAPVP